ncbi:sugar ABC transporter substrate-binding protein [Kineococcus sp. NUM-3379]
MSTRRSPRGPARSRRHATALTAGFATLALLTTSCSGGTSRGAAEAPGPGTSSGAAVDGKGEVKGDIRLAFWGSGPRVELTNGVAKLFTDANPGTTVTSEFADFSAYWQRLNVQASSGNMPCVTQVQGRQLNDYTTKGVFLDLQPMIDSGAIDVSAIPPEVLDTGRGLDGKLYEIPYGAAYDAVMVNQTLAEQAGVGLPADGYTWDDFGDYIRRAKAGLPQGVPAANLGGGRPNYFIAWVRSHGEDLFDGTKIGFQEKTLVEYWNFWESLRAEGATTTPQQTSEQPTQTEQSYVAQGQVMLDTNPGNALGPAQKTLDGKGTGQQLTTVRYPSDSGGSGNVLFTSGFAIPVNCDNVPTAAAFVNFWINDDEGAALFASNNGAVTNREHLEAQLGNPDLPPAQKHLLELFQEIVAEDPPTVVYPPGYQANFEAAFTRAYERISLGGEKVEDVAAAFVDEVDAALAAG